jgi:hypothetical protein
MMDKRERAAEWYPYEENIWDMRESTIDARDWLDKPAGKHGWLQTENNTFVFEDGTSIKFWGTNVTEKHVHPVELGPAFVNRLAKLGMNAVRFHKFTWPTTGIVVSDGHSTELDPVKLDRMDRFFADLRAEGIYVTWSHLFGHMVTEHDALESGFVGMDLFLGEHNSYGLVNTAEDIQDLIIQLTVNLLDHINPYTGLRYADDPALAMLELQNEDNIFFFAEQKAQKYPYYWKLLNSMFSEWLAAKYNCSESEWIAAWGKEAVEEKECMLEGTVQCRFKDQPLHTGQAGYRPQWKQRLLDTARFLHEMQNRYYMRYSEAIRATGYKGVIIGSPWFTPEGIPHYYNLLSDALVGPIDRHAYWGGSKGHALQPGSFAFPSMLESPGSALLKRGGEQVAGLPYLVSEWNCTLPNEWFSEGPFLVAAYGLGLQGWGGSFSYAMDHFNSIYSTNTPPHLGQYPALARMLYRGDLKEADWIKLQLVDTATFLDDPVLPDPVDQEWIAVGKVGISFPQIISSEGERDTISQHQHYWDRNARVIRSSTGQLIWDYGQCLITLNTPGTQGFVGFTRGRDRLTFDDFSVENINTPFVNLLLASLEKEPIPTSRRLLLSALARCQRTGMRYSEDGMQLEQVGELPLLIEPVQARIILHRTIGTSAEQNESNSSRVGTPMSAIIVNILDQQGCRTGRQVSVEQQPDGYSFRIDGQHQAFWYEIIIQ